MQMVQRNNIVLLLLAMAICGGIIFLAVRPRPAAAPSSASTPPAPEAKLLSFSREGLPGAMTLAVEAVVRPREAAAALCEKPEGRFMCVAVDSAGPEKYAQLDRDLTEEQFPFLRQMNFTPPPFQVSRSMSTYRSVAKRAANFDDVADRMIVLVCPKSDWAQLRIVCPDMTLKSVEPSLFK